MSLFQARQWWRARLGQSEEFGFGALVVANIDNAEDGMPKIVTGSLHGMLRIQLPEKQQEGNEEGHDQLLEQVLDGPILQLEAGRLLLPGSNELGLAVLHPRRLVIYRVVKAPGGGRALEAVFKHDLGIDGKHFTAYNMCVGPFGGNSHDCVMVQSMDGRVEVYDQAAHSMSRRLPGCLLPGPLLYVEKMDAFVTATSGFEVECYSYRAITAAKDSANDDSEDAEADREADIHSDRSGRSASTVATSPQTRGRRRDLVADWKICVGEAVLEIQTGRLSQDLKENETDIIVLCGKTLFCLRENGTIRAQHRYEYEPSTMCLYSPTEQLVASAQTRHPTHQNLIMGTFESQLRVFKDHSVLVWSACVDTPPVGLAVAKFGAVSNLIVTLDGDGLLTVNYLGTDPPTASVVAPARGSVDYEEIDDEHRKLLAIIRESQSTGGSQDAWERVELRVTCSRVVDSPPTHPLEIEAAQEYARQAGDLAADRHGSLVTLTARLFVKYTGRGKLKNVCVNVDVPPFVRLRERSFTIAELSGGTATPLTIPIAMHVCTTFIANDLTATVTALFTSEGGKPRSAKTTFQLPLNLACELTSPHTRQKGSSSYKLTVDTNKPPCQLVPLFEDVFAQFSNEDEAFRVAGNTVNSVLCFKYRCLPPPNQDGGDAGCVDATILVSKNTGRYRIQSAYLPAVYLIMHELVQRLRRYFAALAEAGVTRQGEGKEGEIGGVNDPLVVSYGDQLPLQDFFATIDAHFARRGALLEANSVLNDRAHQYRMIEKRLLVRFKEKSPSPLEQMDLLLADTSRQIIELGHAVEQAQMDLRLASVHLSCVVSLVNCLIQWRFGLSETDAGILAACLTPHVRDADDQGWEEQVDGALTHLLKTYLAKSAPAATQTQASTPSMPKDTSKLKKHITIICDRLSKGGVLSRNARASAQQPAEGDEAEAKRSSVVVEALDADGEKESN